MEGYDDTLLAAMNDLKQQGYVEDFNLMENCLACREEKFKIFHDEFKIDKFFRFEGDSNPADASILYAISSEKYNLKGILINGYGVYTDGITDQMLKKLE